MACSDEPDVPRHQTLPTAPYISVWLAATWRAFGYLDGPATLMQHRSFDQGTVQLPDEPNVAHELRVSQHRMFDAAEREVLDLLASGRVTAKGQRPARAASGKQLHHPNTEPVDIPAHTFLNPELAFTPRGELIVRAPLLKRMFGPPELRGSDADPDFPLYYNVLIHADGLRQAWMVDLPESGMPNHSAPSEKQVKRSPSRRDYVEVDKPLIEDMRRMLLAGAATSRWDAALAVADRAASSNTKLESRAKRLLARYSEAFSSEHD